MLIAGLGIGFFGVNVLCGLAVNSFDPESFVGKLLHYIGSLLMIALGVLLIFIGRSTSVFNLVETIPNWDCGQGLSCRLLIPSNGWLFLP